MAGLVTIAEGWYNFTTGNRHVKELMSKRLAICDVCPHKQQLSTAGKLIVTKINKEASLFKCAICTCPLAAKTAAMGESCPDNPKRWDIAGT